MWNFREKEQQRYEWRYSQHCHILLTLTWCHRTPADTPTRLCITIISLEHQLDDVACACYAGRHGCAAALLHQGCPVAVADCQVVLGTGGTPCQLNVKCSELQRKDQSLLHLYRLCSLNVVRVVVRIVWGGDFACCKENELRKKTFSTIFFLPLTFDATAVCRTRGW